VSSIGTLRDAATGGSPYIGLAYYTQNEAAIFFGRDAERTVLISNLRASRLTLLYAQSGTGKSSLLRAGVAARLGELARRGLEQRGTAGNIPVVFSSWRDEPTDELIAEIQRSIIPFLPEASLPETTHQRLEEAIDAATKAANATLLVMLDQFEEYLIYRPTEVRPGRFADELASCINRANLRANFLISIREDTFSGLGDLFQQRIENVYGNYLHLEHLDRASARQAIEKPIACFNELHKLEVPFQIEPGLVDAVLSQLSPDQFVPGRGGIGGLVGGNGAGRHTDEIAAPYLQLVMLRLWDVERAVGSRELRLQTLEELGGARTIIGTYVDRTLGSLPDDDREMAVDVFHHLVTPSGTKIALTASDLAEYTGHSVNETTALLEQLASYKTRILRAIAPLPGREGGTLYEISHDLLARAILDWGRRHRAARLELEKEAAEQQAQTEKKRARRFGKIAIWAAIITVFAIIVATLALSSPEPSISARPAAIGFGRVSLGNLSQTPSPVDVYLYSSGISSPQFVKHGVAYGTILPYHAVNAGHYTVKVRAAGASASSNPAWYVSFTVHAGSSYTVAPLRATAQQGQLRVIDNDLTAPTGKSLVRVIQADLNQDHVTFHCSCAAGAPGNITTDAAPGTVSRQTAIPAGTWTMTATGPGAKASLPVTLTDGTVHTEIVISKPGGGIKIINLVQAPPSYQRVPVDLPFAGPSSPITSVAFSPSGATLAIPAAQICLWDIAAKDCTRTLDDASAYSLAFSPDGKTLAVTDGINSGRTYLWNVATGRPAAPLTDPNSTGAYSVAFTHNGKLLAVGDGNGHTYLWDVATRKLIFPFTDPGSQGVNSVAFSPDDKILAVGDGNGATYLWDVATRKLIFPLSDPGAKGVMSVAFSPDGKLLVAGDHNGRTYLWGVATGKLISALPDPGAGGVVSVACSPDNTTVAAGGKNGSIYIWNVRNGKLLATLAAPDKAVINSVAFSPDGQVLAAGDNNGSVFLWYKS
jgi:sugar lactone lactonase YvrE